MDQATFDPVRQSVPNRSDIHLGWDQQHPGVVLFVGRDNECRAGLIYEGHAPNDAAIRAASAFAKMIVADDRNPHSGSHLSERLKDRPRVRVLVRVDLAKIT